MFMKKYNIILVIIMLLVVAGVYYFTKDMPKELYGVVGPSQWPRFIAIVMLIFTWLLLFQTVAGKSGSPSPLNFKSKGLKRVIILLGILVVFGVTLPILGFLVSSCLFIAAVMVAMDEKSKLRILLSSIGITGLIYIFFGFLLNVILPQPFFM